MPGLPVRGRSISSAPAASWVLRETAWVIRSAAVKPVGCTDGAVRAVGDGGAEDAGESAGARAGIQDGEGLARSGDEAVG